MNAYGRVCGLVRYYLWKKEGEHARIIRADSRGAAYGNLLKEYVSNGRNYFSADGAQTFAVDEYGKTIEADIKAGAEKLPLTVSGGVALVCAQTAPNHLPLFPIKGTGQVP